MAGSLHIHSVMCWGKTIARNMRASKEMKIPVNSFHKAFCEVIFLKPWCVGHLEERITGVVGSLSFFYHYSKQYRLASVQSLLKGGKLAEKIRSLTTNIQGLNLLPCILVPAPLPPQKGEMGAFKQDQKIWVVQVKGAVTWVSRNLISCFSWAWLHPVLQECNCYQWWKCVTKSSNTLNGDWWQNLEISAT